MRKLPRQSFFKNKRVLIRVDFNVEIGNGKVIDDFDILRALKTIKHVSSQAKYVLLISHLGNPKEGEKLMSLTPVAHHLSKLLKKKVHLVFGRLKDLKQSLSILPKGSMVLLENIRFYSGEYSRGGYVDSKTFAEELASLGDCYVNEAFGESHRKVSSIFAVTKFLPSFAGFNLQDEIKHLDKLKIKPLLSNAAGTFDVPPLSNAAGKFDLPQKPFVLILGGAKLKTKLSVIKSFVPKAGYILLGGALANTFLRAQGLNIGKSLYEKEFIFEAKKLLKHKNIILPRDVVVAKSLRSKNHFLLPVVSRKSLVVSYIGDIGPGTIKQYQEIIKSAKTIIWNGPMGYYENPVFAKGTKTVAKAVFANKKAFKVIGGGDTVAFLRKAGIMNKELRIKNLFISTGGGAMLEYLAGKKLPGIEALK